jgi:hypothetical protein
MPTIRFSATPYAIGTMTIVRLPKDASVKLPSRGMAMAEGTINGSPFELPLEPDGKGSHWFKAEKAMHISAGDSVKLEMEPMKEWPEPAVPADIKKGIATVPQAQKTWKETTPMARWDWIRWIRATNNPETRAKRIVVACSKLKSGERRPCCFNRSMCTEPAVSKGGVLLDPTK